MLEKKYLYPIIGTWGKHMNEIPVIAVFIDQNLLAK